MSWSPYSRGALEADLAAGLETADDEVRREWDAIRVPPVKWKCSPWGDEGGGFWVVAVWDGHVGWYNDIEDGFQTSRYSVAGTIDEYWCNQDDFSSWLGGVPSAVAMRSAIQARPSHELPEGCSGAGVIAARKSASWTLQLDSGQCVQVRFADLREAHVAERRFTSVELLDVHPVLNRHHENWASIFLASATTKGVAIAQECDEALRAATRGFRSSECSLAESLFASGHGLLMEGPESEVHVVKGVLDQNGVEASVVPRQRGHAGMRAVVLERSFVVAGAFQIAFLGDRPEK